MGPHMLKLLWAEFPCRPCTPPTSCVFPHVPGYHLRKPRLLTQGELRTGRGNFSKTPVQVSPGEKEPLYRISQRSYLSEKLCLATWGEFPLETSTFLPLLAFSLFSPTFFLIEVQLIYNVGYISDVQQSDLVMHICCFSR